MGEYPWISMIHEKSHDESCPEILLPLMESWTSQRTWPTHVRVLPWEEISPASKKSPKGPTERTPWVSNSSINLLRGPLVRSHPIFCCFRHKPQTNTVGFAEGWFRLQCNDKVYSWKCVTLLAEKRRFHHVLPLKHYATMPSTWTSVCPIIWNHKRRNTGVFDQNW